MLQFIYSLFLLFVLSILVGCHGIDHKKNNSDISHTQIKSAPAGSYIKNYVDGDTSNHFEFYMNKNIGYDRCDTETLMIETLSSSISFLLKHNATLTTLKTPLTLFEVLDHQGNIALSLKIQSHYAWLEAQEQTQQIPLYLDTQDSQFAISYDHHAITITIDGRDYHFQHTTKMPRIRIGLKRNDLLRYRGQVVPKQILRVHNMKS